MNRPLVVATGVSSFVGMHLARRFAAEGFHVVGTLSRPRESYDGIRAQRLQALDGLVGLEQLDLTDAPSVDAFVRRMRPSLWLHHAGFANNYGSLDYDFAAGFAANVAPLTPLYQALAGIGNVIVTGSSAEYSSSDRANREEDLCLPDTPYGLSKLTETLRARQLSERYGVPTRVARLYIPFGLFDHPEKLLSQVVAGLRAGRAIDLSPCEQARDFLGIDDLCAAYLKLDKDMSRQGFDIFNICGGRAMTLRSFLQDIAARMKADPGLLRFGARPMRDGEAMMSSGDNSKAQRLLNWSPSDLAVAIDRDLLTAVPA